MADWKRSKVMGSFAKKPRKDKDKKPKKPHRYKTEGGARKYMCPEHDRWHMLTPKQLTGEHPIKCTGHDITADFGWIERFMLRGN